MESAEVGSLIRARRLARGQSQMTLSLLAGLSTRHLSFVELGKAKPSREMITLLAHHLGLSFRETNHWLRAAGFAPKYPEHDLSDDALAAVVRPLQDLIDAHSPYPAAVVDGCWNVKLVNDAVILLTEDLNEAVRSESTNIFRLSLHPEGLARITTNTEEWFAYLLRQLQLLLDKTNRDALHELADEVASWPNVPDRSTWRQLRPAVDGSFVVPWRLRFRNSELSFFTVMATLGAPLDITLDELTAELFFPADEVTRDAMQRHLS